MNELENFVESFSHIEIIFTIANSELMDKVYNMFGFGRFGFAD